MFVHLEQLLTRSLLPSLFFEGGGAAEQTTGATDTSLLSIALTESKRANRATAGGTVHGQWPIRERGGGRRRELGVFPEEVSAIPARSVFPVCKNKSRSLV